MSSVSDPVRAVTTLPCTSDATEVALAAPNTVEKLGILRRSAELPCDYADLLRMQRLSWGINFPGVQFSEPTFWGSLQAATDRSEVYVYEQESELVGWLWLDLSARGIAAHVRHLQVKRSLWGMDLGRLILEDAIVICASAGCAAVTLNVTKSNSRAMKLYTGAGFRVAEDNGDRQHMRLELAATAGVRQSPGHSLQLE